jgi:hypothetical protein
VTEAEFYLAIEVHKASCKWANCSGFYRVKQVNDLFKSDPIDMDLDVDPDRTYLHYLCRSNPEIALNGSASPIADRELEVLIDDWYENRKQMRNL